MKWKLFILLISACFAFGGVQEPTPEERGKRLFELGKSFDKSKVIAVMSGVEVPAAVLPCASCHGKDGKGKPEGGVVPSNLTWAALTTAYEGKRSSGRTHPAYTEKSIKKAIALGLDPAGNALHSTMPRYKMTQQDMSDLIAYLKILGMDSEVGISDETIKIGWLPIIEGEQPKVDAAQKAVVAAFFAEVNEQGGIYNRQLELVEEQDASFALTGSFLLSNVQLTNTQFDTKGMPYISGLDMNLEGGNFPKDQSFFIYPNLAEQVAIWASEQDQKIPTILVDDTPAQQALLARMQQKSRKPLKTKTLEKANLSAVLATLKTEETESVLLLSQTLEMPFLQAMEQEELELEVLLLGGGTRVRLFELPDFFNGRIQLLYPTWPTAISDSGKATYQQLQHKYLLQPNYQQSQIASLATAAVLVDALIATGRDLTHEGFINQLEKMYQRTTAYTPPLTFTKNRHVGAQRLFVVRYLGRTAGMKLEQTIN